MTNDSETTETAEPVRMVWQRFGPEGTWSTELDESDRLALVGHRDS